MDAQALAKLIAVRALHTFWQSFSAAAAVLWAGSGLDVAQLTDISAVEKLLSALAAAALASALSAVKSVLVATLSTTPATAVVTPVVFATVEPAVGPQTLPGVSSAGNTAQDMVLEDLPIENEAALEDLPIDDYEGTHAAGDTDNDLTSVTG